MISWVIFLWHNYNLISSIYNLVIFLDKEDHNYHNYIPYSGNFSNHCFRGFHCYLEN